MPFLPSMVYLSEPLAMNNTVDSVLEGFCQARAFETTDLSFSNLSADQPPVTVDISSRSKVEPVGYLTKIWQSHSDRLVGRFDFVELLTLLLTVYCLVGLPKKISSYARSRSFHHWARSTGCEPCSALPRPIFASIRHKLRLMNVKGADLLDHVFAEKYRRYGPTHALHDAFGVPRVIHTIDPVNVNAFLVSSFEDWKPSISRTNTLYPLAQEGLLTTDGKTWLNNRKLIHRAFGARNAKDTKLLEKDVDLLFTAIGNADASGWTKEVNLLEVFHRMALDMSTTYLLGTSADSQAKGIRESAKEEVKKKYNLIEARRKKQGYTYDEAYEVIRDYFSWRAKLGSKYWLADGFEYRSACATITDFADDLVNRAIGQSEAGGQHSFGLISRLVAVIGDAVAIRELVMDLFIAGQNMTGTIAAWLFAQLNAHPDLYQQVREEVVKMFGTEEYPRASMTWSSLRACKLLQWCILETLRLYPLLANIGRNARRDTILPRGGGSDGNFPVAIPAGASMTANIYLMHRRREEWGDDAWEWKPLRWSGRKTGIEFAPFGAGPRICIGQQMSMTEVSFLTARMLQRFNAMQAPVGQDNLTKDYRVAINPAYGVKVRLQHVV